MRLAIYQRLLTLSFLALMAIEASAGAGASWWNPEWTVRKKVTIDASAAGVTAPDSFGAVTILLRLHEGNFAFGSAKEDGSDIRIVSADDKTLLPYHIEKFDGLLNEAFVWIKVPELKPGSPVVVWLYYGNAGPSATQVGDSKA